MRELSFDSGRSDVFSLGLVPMATFLSDREIKKLLGDVIKGASENLVSPNGIELRLGNKVRFITTGEEKKIADGHFVKVHPGENVIIVSIETLDLTKATVQKHFPGCMLMAFITPTTTMMREGMIQCSTKVHAGYAGQLNWGFRNSSFKDFLMQQGEPIFNLTLILLQGDEVPDVSYGEKAEHKYQNTDGIMLSQRRIPADIPASKVVSSSFEKLDPKKQLREAGPPFSHIGTELLQLQGKFELVSSDVRGLTEKIEQTKDVLLDKVESVFKDKFLWAASLIVGAISVLFGLVQFLQKTSLTSTMIAALAIIVGIAIPAVVWLINKK
jgi:deoxycytidine triphosphate deaminase